MIGGSTRRATAVGTLSRRVPVGRVAKAVDRIERGGDLAKRRAQPLQQALRLPPSA